MFDLLDQLATRFSSVMAGVLFDDPADLDVPREIRVFKLGLQPKRYRTDQGQDYPFTTMRLLGGDDKVSASLLRVELIAGIYVNPDRDGDGTIDAADDMIGAASAAMNQVVSGFRSLALDGNYFPYSLESMTWQVGDKDGLHPGPDYYQVSAVLVFSQAPVF